MSPPDFLAHVGANDSPERDWPDTWKALWHAEKGDWIRAHLLAQDIPSADGSWIHACLHREEGDLWNARYWYRQAGRPESSRTIAAERREILAALLSEHGKT